VAETPAADFDRVLAVNLRGPFLTTRALLPLLRAGRGSVVNVSSVHAVASAPGHGAYASSKAALLALTRVTALEERANGVRVNEILPGSINTGMTLAALRDSAEPGAADLRIPPELMATAEQAASAIYLLTQPDASFVTGACLVADGGLLAQLT
jgi:NAD(P)-dependent dehydrogenase (short-subunit alcohol dehydrogenase family)